MYCILDAAQSLSDERKDAAVSNNKPFSKSPQDEGKNKKGTEEQKKTKRIFWDDFVLRHRLDESQKNGQTIFNIISNWNI